VLACRSWRALWTYSRIAAGAGAADIAVPICWPAAAGQRLRRGLEAVHSCMTCAGEEIRQRDDHVRLRGIMQSSQSNARRGAFAAEPLSLQTDNRPPRGGRGGRRTPDDRLE